MMSEISVRNLAGFNEKVRAAAGQGQTARAAVSRPASILTAGEEIYEDRQLDYRESSRRSC